MNDTELVERVEANTELAQALKARYNELLAHLKTLFGDDVVLDLLTVTEGEI